MSDITVAYGEHKVTLVPHLRIHADNGTCTGDVYDVKLRETIQSKVVSIVAETKAEIYEIPLPTWDVIVKAVEDLRKR